jgi:hypothetical protein
MVAVGLEGTVSHVGGGAVGDVELSEAAEVSMG